MKTPDSYIIEQIELCIHLLLPRLHSEEDDKKISNYVEEISNLARGKTYIHFVLATFFFLYSCIKDKKIILAAYKKKSESAMIPSSGAIFEPGAKIVDAPKKRRVKDK